MSVTFLFHPSARRKEQLRLVAEQADVPMGELLRRMIDHCTQPHILAEILPHLSGQIKVG